MYKLEDKRIMYYGNLEDIDNLPVIDIGVQDLFSTKEEFYYIKEECEGGELSFEEFFYIVLEYVKKDSHESINKTSDIGKVLIK